jgi:prepilin-type N-terminal cleavage/methylation domain-containing protein
MKKSRAFTLVEIIVSLAIFSVVAVVALGALVKIISANKKAQSLQSAITNLNYAMESISREMRVGKDYACGGSYSNSGDTCSLDEGDDDIVISFESPKKSLVVDCYLRTAYRFSLEDGIGKWRQDPNNDCTDSPSASDFSPILDPNVNIDGYYVFLNNLTGLSMATMRISGYTGVRERERTYFDLQTSIYPRIQDN